MKFRVCDETGEYGIPAVVNLAGATKVLKDGEHIVVDGDEGKVYIEKGSQEEKVSPYNTIR